RSEAADSAAMADRLQVLERVRRRLEAAGQAHVLRFWPELGEPERERLLQQLALLPLERLAEHVGSATGSAPERVREWEQLAGPRGPGPGPGPGRPQASPLSAGLSLISQERVGVLLLAGGQGTRLGVPYPKGMFDVGLPSGKTLYQIQAERLRRLQELLGVGRHGSRSCVPWYIHPTQFTQPPTLPSSRRNHHFGLEPSNIVMFEQRMIPAVSFQGDVLLHDKAQVAMAPDGNGPVCTRTWRGAGVEYLHVYCVDNILVKMADPVFIGFCVSRGADCGAKVVEKTDPAEPLGVVCKVGDSFQVVEYSEIQPETAELRGPGGALVFSAGNICNHFFTRRFLEDVVEGFKDQLKQHVAIKKVPFVDPSGNQVQPSKANGIKMEKFVFDVFPFSRNFVVFEVAREDEFSPLKNAEGRDSPSTARSALLAQHRRWLLAAGATLLEEDGGGASTTPRAAGPPAGGGAPGQWEVSPLLSYSGEGLEDLLRGRRLPTPFVLDQRSLGELQD
uniref:UDP-N-acetylglucosamine pyrophosphorylase 1, like 1 n=1 Tax=Tetraodon nigroviridis TaxID=99883 RepID=H3CBN2_TETNG